MTTIAFASAKGSPGVTTTMLGIAAAWTDVNSVIVAECDPAGGDLAHRFSLSTELGIVSLVGDSGRDGMTLTDHVQSLPGGLRAIVSSPSVDQASAAIGRLVHHNPFIVGGGTTVLLDCGRMEGRSPALAFATEADLVAVVTRPTVAAVSHVASLIGLLRQHGNAIGLVVVGHGPYQAGDVAGSLGVPLLGSVAFDERAAGLMGGEPGSSRQLSRSPLMRSCRVLTEQLQRVGNVFTSAELAS